MSGLEAIERFDQGVVLFHFALQQSFDGKQAGSIGALLKCPVDVLQTCLTLLAAQHLVERLQFAQ